MEPAGQATTPNTLGLAAGLLRAGSPVLLPVEGGFVLAVGAGASLVGRLADPSWMATDREGLEAAATGNGGGRGGGGVAARLIRRLAPGPVIFRFASELKPPAPKGSFSARLTAHPFTLAALVECGQAVVGAEVVNPRGALIPDFAEALDAAAGAGFLTESPNVSEPLGRSVATIVEVAVGGAIRIIREGAYEERFIRKQLAMNVLFVCTGNTCRSPMAEAIATALSAKGIAADESVEMRFVSAGTAAGSGGGAGGGGGASAEAVRAVKGLEIGASLGSHRPRPLTRKLIAEADAIFTMGRSHMHAILELDPEAAGRVQLLDPDGHDVPDPVGMSERVYMQTAQSIMAMWKRRMKELGR